MSDNIRNMFSDIAGQYDFLNDLLSFGRHRIWKKKFVKKLALKESAKHLDVATGTGDIANQIVKQYGGNVEVIGVDFSEEMIVQARFAKDSSLQNLNFEVGDATKLNFDDGYFNSVSISFGIRNIPELEKSIIEMARVIKSGGTLAIMEFGTPNPFINIFYKIYSKFIIPLLGKIISGNGSAYTYLPETIKKFPYGEEFIRILNSTNQFTNIEVQKFDFGVVYCYYCTKK